MELELTEAQIVLLSKVLANAAFDAFGKEEAPEIGELLSAIGLQISNYSRRMNT